MFTGIITDIGTVRTVEQRGDLRLTIATAYDLATVDLGASIACSGVCLTVVDKGTDWFAVEVSHETVSRTASRWTEGEKLNLERALRMGDELGGHLVTGHVDETGTVLGIYPDGASSRINVQVSRDLGRFIAAKGSITLDGVSLTVNGVKDGDDGTTGFAINLIPHSAEHTTLGSVAVGQSLNIEIDVLARYLKRLEESRSSA